MAAFRKTPFILQGHYLMKRLLDQTVYYCWDTQLAISSLRLAYTDATDT